MQTFEQIGELYLGRYVDPETKKRAEEYYLYDVKDLTTHAMIVGMTGSGKTGLGVAMMEELAIDGLPAIVIDPKGDMTNLLLSFPQMQAEDFKPWLSHQNSEAELEELAQKTASNWKEGLADWDIDPSQRIPFMESQSDFVLYTPGSKVGRQLALLPSFDPPPDQLRQDTEAYNSYIANASRNLLSLLGRDTDSLTSSDYVLISNLIKNQWDQALSFDLQKLIQLIINPPFQQLGVMPLETLYPADKRMELAIEINNLLASPEFSNWLEGDPLDIDQLLYGPNRRPQIAILSISHLSDQERMFFVSTLLNHLVAWMRRQSGTSTLRAALYMDEIFGYFPPVANPPSKEALLTLLKQARAYGLGLILATQNPVDLDYKGLSNIGTWFIGRLQTENDKNRLLDGLERVLSSTSKADLSSIISGLAKRNFLVDNVHDPDLFVFETRWTMSYLAGPLMQDQLVQLSNAKPAESSATSKPAYSDIELKEISFSQEDSPQAVSHEEELLEGYQHQMPEIHSDIGAYFLASEGATDSKMTFYRPSLYAQVRVQYDDKKLSQRVSEDLQFNTPISDRLVAVDWSVSSPAVIDQDRISSQAQTPCAYEITESDLSKKTIFNNWAKDLKDFLYEDRQLMIYEIPSLDLFSSPKESKEEFLLRANQVFRENRDLQVSNLKESYQKKRDSIEDKIQRAENSLQTKEGQARDSNIRSVVDIGSTLLDSFLGNKRFKLSSLNKASRSAKSLSTASRRSSEVEQAESKLQAYQEELQHLEEDLNRDLQTIPQTLNENDLLPSPISLKKMNINVQAMTVIWLPYQRDLSGDLQASYLVSQKNSSLE